MFKSMARRLSYANVTATLALVFSMSGGALAASHYLINSTRQINPHVLTRLRGNTGPVGPAGPQGPPGPAQAGAAGAAGASGAAGTAKAFGAVNGGGALVGASKNVAGVYKAAEGKYCIQPSASWISPSSTLIVATIDASGTNGGNALARASAVNCPSGDFEVDTIVYRETGTGIFSEFHAEPFSFAIP
jgi:hypothetical protein